jgi:acetamidase/formamidase
MGVAPPPAMGRISSAPPGVQTWNIDKKDITARTTLYMPVDAPGALFSVGDGHAAQGQGEVDLSIFPQSRPACADASRSSCTRI